MALGLVVASPAPSWPAGDVLLDTAVYNAETKSYFQLVKIGKGYSIRGKGVDAITWDNARKYALGLRFHGVPGRLAIVPSASVDAFLRDTFRAVDPTWIGLRYWCHLGKLQWVDGSVLSRGNFQKWGVRWDVHGGSPDSPGNSPCDNDNPYQPVHYWAVKDGFRWNANGTHKELHYLFVEFPTGQE
jgi:hypothetical protein